MLAERDGVRAEVGGEVECCYIFAFDVSGESRELGFIV